MGALLPDTIFRHFYHFMSPKETVFCIVAEREEPYRPISDLFDQDCILHDLAG